MKRVFFLLLTCLLSACSKDSQKKQALTGSKPITLVIHGGAGTILRSNMSAELEAAYHAKLREALDTGFAVLDRGGRSLEAVVATIKILEDSPLFNAGKGAVFTNDEQNELDASIMDGSNLMAGAVAGVSTIKNPIVAAYAVMTRSEHVMLVGKGAELFAEEEGLDIVPPSYFFDSARYRQLLHLKEADVNARIIGAAEKYGTVGCVALDRFGDLAAGTSTGGMMNKKYGRVGDSPIIGAGTYANNATCAVSSTGWGEYFMRLNAAYDVHALMAYGGVSVTEAADSVIQKKLPGLGGSGGLIALDHNGNFTMTFCTTGMYRGYITKKNQSKTFIYRE